MSTISNIPYMARSVNGIITISDGTAILQNGALTNVNNIETDTISTNSFSTDDFIVNTNVDLTGNTSKVQFLYNNDPTNTVIDRLKIDTLTLNASDVNASTGDITILNTTDIITDTLDANTIITTDISASSLTAYTGSFSTSLTAPTMLLADDSTHVATTEWVKNQGYATSTSIPANIDCSSITIINNEVYPNNVFTLNAHNDTSSPSCFQINRYSSTPATNDRLFALDINGRDSSNFNTIYGRMRIDIDDPTNGATKGGFYFDTQKGGSFLSRLHIGADKVEITNCDNFNVGATQMVIQDTKIIQQAIPTGLRNEFKASNFTQLFIDGTEVNAGLLIDPTLEQVLAQNNSVGNYNLNMNNKQIQNVNTLNFSTTGTIHGTNLYINSNIDVSGNATMDNITIQNNATINNLSTTGTTNLGNVSFASPVSTLTGTMVKVVSNFDVSGNTTLNKLDVSGSAIFNNLKYVNTTSNIPITRGNFDTPSYPTGNNLLYTGTATYTGYSGWTFSSNGSTFSVYIVSGLFQAPYYVQEYTSGSQALVLVPSTPMIAKTDTYTLQPGEYILSFYVQAQNYSTAPIMNASVKTSTSTLFQITGIDPTPNYPLWVQYKMPFLITENNTGVWFEFQNSYAYICLDTLVLTMDSAIIVTDGVKSSAIGGSQTMLNGVYVKGGVNVTDGGANIKGGITINTTYGQNNLALNTSMGELETSVNLNTIAIGTGALQIAETAINTICIGNASNSQTVSSSNNILIGYNTSCYDTTDNVVIGSMSCCRGGSNVVIGSSTPDIGGGVLNTNNVAIGIQCFQRYNGFAVLTGCEQNVAVGAYSQYSNADKLSSSVGAFSLYNMAGSNGITTEGENGFTCQRVSAFGSFAGYTHQQYNNCTFLGANTDATINNLFNATAIGYNCKVDASNTIQIGSNGERVKISGDLAGITTINGITYSPGGGSLGSLSQVLSIGNKANMAIDMSQNDLQNVNLITSKRMVQSQTNQTNPDISLENITNTAVGVIVNSTKKRGAALPLVNGDDLYTMNFYGTDASNVVQLYAKDQVDVVSITKNVIEGSRTFSVAQGGNMVEVLKLNSYVTASRPLILNNTGFNQAYRTIPLSANDTYASVWANYVGSHILVSQTGAQGWVLTIGNGVDYQGGIVNIENTSIMLLTIQITAGTFLGTFKNNLTTYPVYPGQTIEMVGIPTGYRILAIKGLPMTYRMKNSAAQSLPTSSTTLLYNTEETTGIQVTTGIRTWGALSLGYNAGTFSNPFDYPITLSVQATCITANANIIRAFGMQQGNTTRFTPINTNWIMIPSNTSSAATMSINQNVYLGIGDTFKIVAQAFGSATTINAGSQLIITRLA